MTVIEKISASEARPLIDKMLMENYGYEAVAWESNRKHGTDFSPENIKDYKKNVFNKGDSTVHQIIKATEDLKQDLPIIGDTDKLSAYFGFKKTCEDLDLIYDRIRELKVFSKDNPEDPTYDRRIRDYLAQAEAIRTRVFRHQYEKVRKALLVTIGKKLVTASVSILLPYVHREKKVEAMERFQAAINPLLDTNSIPDIPSDIQENG